jgi:hypothetical protein
VRIEAAQKQASLFVSLGLKSYSQLFKRKANEVSDALSRNDDRSNDKLTKIIKTFCPSQVPSCFKIHWLPNKNHLVADCVAAQITNEQAVERGTHEKQAWAWRRWKEYIESIKIKKDKYLVNFTREQQHTIIGAFALALQEARFSKPNYERLATGTVSSTVQYVCTSFQEWGYPKRMPCIYFTARI